jgi:hypothetical protein
MWAQIVQLLTGVNRDELVRPGGAVIRIPTTFGHDRYGQWSSTQGTTSTPTLVRRATLQGWKSTLPMGE